jgi:hypothetical protein
MIMKLFKTKLILSAVGIALLATPALAQESYRHASARKMYDYRVPANDSAGTYPNPVTHSGSAAQLQSGAAFNTDQGY